MNAATRDQVAVRTRSAGQSFSWGGLDFEVFGPPADKQFGKKVEDDDSMVLRVSYRNTSALFVGDIGKSAEAHLTALNPHADLLKVGHHGSLTSTAPEFLRAVAPKYAVISVGKRNSFRHPRPEVLQRLAAAHVNTYRTDLFGAVRFDLDGITVRATPLGLRESRQR